jgi:PAN domain
MLIAFSVLLLVASASAFKSISWNDNEALGCFFRGNDLGHVRMHSELCRDECAQTEGCTHYTWTTYNEGTCWMKSGPVNKTDAFQAYDLSMICGLRELGMLQKLHKKILIFNCL